MPWLAAAMANAGAEVRCAIRHIRLGEQNGRYCHDQHQGDGAAEDDPPGSIARVRPRPVLTPPALRWLHGGSHDFVTYNDRGDALQFAPIAPSPRNETKLAIVCRPNADTFGADASKHVLEKFH